MAFPLHIGELNYNYFKVPFNFRHLDLALEKKVSRLKQPGTFFEQKSKGEAMNSQKVNALQEKIESVVHKALSPHPFLNVNKNENLEEILANYFAMSQAFPYLQAGAMKDLFWNDVYTRGSVSPDVEQTSVVGAFLTWDEFGGHFQTLKRGNPGLPFILNTQRGFHANMFREDIETLLGKSIVPFYSETTKKYLMELYEGLSHQNETVRCAAMIAFEMHAEQMITALWEGLANIFPNVSKERLRYFNAHVGGDDPAEAYHVMMTTKLMENVLVEDSEELFFSSWKKYYVLNFQWCFELVKETKIERARVS